LFIVVRVGPTMFYSTRLLHHWFLWHLLVIKISYPLLQIMACHAMDLAPLLCISRMTE
jgi:hypothetical protein